MTETYVYDAFGKLAAEYSTTAPTIGGTFYRTTDHLGSTRLVTKQDKSDADCYDYAPFGEEIPNTLGNRSSNACFAASFDGRHRFTGQERDDESDLDYFLARYYSGPMGRFTSADEPFVDQHAENPQSWNLYSYVRNSPLRFSDPSGRECIKTEDGEIADNREGEKCEAVAADDATDDPESIVEASGGSYVEALLNNLLFALHNAASAAFAPIFDHVPRSLRPVPTNSESTGQLAEVTVFVAGAVAGRGAGSIWTSRKNLTRVQNAFGHWKRHKKDFPNLQNAKQYVDATHDFVKNPPLGTLTKVRPNGETVLYNPGTNTFAVKTADGTPKTMFKPVNGINYFSAQ